eukprot:TRINITY_DN14440_c0_g1_i10.p1 TRINITY_DN14440_c0_g1~~TRINITY_DN14440_c0_g1_i10.p1  ORF type:complete len:241 (+),score=84.13 TRINITY_DN14440_c0_g1_i10:196-918(+)
MKRSYKLLVSQDLPHKSYGGSDQIFRITRVGSEVLGGHRMSQYKTCSSPKEAELVMTEEQLAKMTPKQQYSRFQDQAYEIKQLRRKLRKFSQTRDKSLEEEVLEAKEVLKNTEFELPDQGLIIDNLVKALKTGALAPNSLQYDRLCAIVRAAMSLKVESKAGRRVSLRDKDVAITEKEQRHYTQLPRSSTLLRALMGEAPQSVKAEEEQRRDVENYLAIHADLIKKMSFKDFVSVVRRER